MKKRFRPCGKCNNRKCRHCINSYIGSFKWSVSNVLKTHPDINQTIHLTLDPNKIEGNAHAYITKVLRSFMGKVRYQHSKNKKETMLKYIWVVGISNTGLPHIHMLWNVKIKKKNTERIRKMWEKSGGGWKMQVEPIRSSHAYLQYLANDNLKVVAQEAPKHVKLYAISHGLQVEKKDEQC